MGNFYDGWLESGIQDAYDDYEDRAERIAYEVDVDLREGGRFYPLNPSNWAEATSQMGMDEALQDIDPQTAPQELRDKVAEYWYDVAVVVNERDCD
jgi:hypothetical protein